MQRVIGKISTAFNKVFDCDLPIVLTPMGGIAGPLLAAAVVKCGGIGFIGTGGQNANSKIQFVSVGDITRKIAVAQALTGPLASNIGIGLVVGGQLEKDPTIIDQIRAVRPRNIWISAGMTLKQVKFDPYCRLVRESFQDADIEDPKIFVQVSSVDEALEAAGAGADVIVVQGCEAGGYFQAHHIETDVESFPSLSSLLSDTAVALQQELANPPLLLGAGGIVCAADVIDALESGADGVCIGTLLGIAEESELPYHEKQNVIAFAKSEASVRVATGDEERGQQHISLAHVNKLHRTNPDGSTVAVRGDVIGRMEHMEKGVRPCEEILSDLMDDVMRLSPMKRTRD